MNQVKTDKRFQKVPWRGMVFFAAVLAFIGWLLNTPAGILGKADAIGYAVCHRIDIRSFHIGQRQLPLCARCTGMYLGAMLGITYQFITGRRRSGWPRWVILLVLGLLVAAFFIDGLNSYLHFFPGIPTLYEPTNLLRLLTGTGMGLAIAAILFPAFNQTVWSDWNALPTIGGWLPLVVLLGLALLVDALVLMENPLVLYPLALISAAGVVVLLTMIYTMIWLMIFKQENRFKKITELVLPLTAGFTVAILQIALSDLARYWLTGTWEGFHLG